MHPSAIDQQLTFLREIDKLKAVVRQSPLLDGSRKENSAEHSWHLAMYAMLLAEHAATPFDMQRVIKMLLIHDIVEVDVGDTPIHSGASLEQQADLEQKAAQRLFGILPAPQRSELLALWQELEAGTSDDAKFAKALDRVQPLLVNVYTNGGTCRERCDARAGSSTIWTHDRAWFTGSLARLPVSGPRAFRKALNRCQSTARLQRAAAFRRATIQSPSLLTPESR
jgi:putative hydrolase of HD superfamily